MLNIPNKYKYLQSAFDLLLNQGKSPSLEKAKRVNKLIRIKRLLEIKRGRTTIRSSLVSSDTNIRNENQCIFLLDGYELTSYNFKSDVFLRYIYNKNKVLILLPELSYIDNSNSKRLTYNLNLAEITTHMDLGLGNYPLGNKRLFDISISYLPEI